MTNENTQTLKEELKRLQKEVKGDAEDLKQSEANFLARAVKEGRTQNELEELGFDIKDIKEAKGSLKTETAEEAATPDFKRAAPESSINPEEGGDNEHYPDTIAGLEQEVSDLRGKYFDKLDAYNKERSWHRKLMTNLSIPENKFSNSRLKALKEKYKDIYDQARVALGQKMYDEKKTELEKAGKSGDELKEALTQYRAKEIFTKVHTEEYIILNAHKAETLPPERKYTLAKAWGWTMDRMKDYSELGKKGPKLFSIGKFDVTTGFLARSAAMSVAFSFLPWGKAVGIGTRITRGLVSGIVGGAVSEKMRVGSEKILATGREALEELKMELQNDFANGEITPAEYEESTRKLEARFKRLERGLLLARTGASLLLGYGTAMGVTAIGAHTPSIGEMLHMKGSEGAEDVIPGANTETVENTTTGKETTTENTGDQSTADQKAPAENSGAGKETTQNPTGETSSEAVTNLGKETVTVNELGGIETAQDIKDKLESMYKDPSQTPANIQKMMDMDKYTLAKFLGFFNPDDPSGEESMKVLAGSTVTIEKDTLTLHNLGKGDTILSSASGAGVEKYSGEMFDYDHNKGPGSATGTTSEKFDVNSAPDESNIHGSEKFDISHIPDGEVGGKMPDGSYAPEGDGAGGASDITHSTDTTQEATASDTSEIEKEINETPQEIRDTIIPNSVTETVQQAAGRAVKIARNAYEDAAGNIVRLEGKSVTFADHKIFVDGKVSPELTEAFELERTTAIEKIDPKMFSWTGNAEKSAEWANIRGKEVSALANPDSQVHEYFKRDHPNGDEEKYIKKLLKNARDAGIDTKTFKGTADQLIEEIAINKMD